MKFSGEQLEALPVYGGDIPTLISHNKSSNVKGSFPCPNCGKTYNWKNNLCRHISVECGKEPRLQCKYCTYKTKHKSSLINHMYTRHGVFHQPVTPQM